MAFHSNKPNEENNNRLPRLILMPSESEMPFFPFTNDGIGPIPNLYYMPWTPPPLVNPIPTATPTPTPLEPVFVCVPKEYKCLFCGSIFNCALSLRSHFRSHYNPLYCGCGKKITSKARLTDHIACSENMTKKLDLSHFIRQEIFCYRTHVSTYQELAEYLTFLETVDK